MDHSICFSQMLNPAIFPLESHFKFSLAYLKVLHLPPHNPCIFHPIIVTLILKIMQTENAKLSHLKRVKQQFCGSLCKFNSLQQVVVVAARADVLVPSAPAAENQSVAAETGCAGCEYHAAGPSVHYPVPLPLHELAVSHALPSSAQLLPTPSCDDAVQPAHDSLAPARTNVRINQVNVLRPT